VLQSGAQFRIPPVPELSSAKYTSAFQSVKQLGGDGVGTPTSRTLEQTRIGIFWGYDGTAWLGPRPRQYNQIAVQLALAATGDPLELARVLALVNVAMADAAIAAWESKYHYRLWRPVTGVREASPGSGPTGLGDGNPATIGDPRWTPLGSPASNLIGPNFTPPFPACPSGHATLGSAMFQILRRLYGDALGFTLVSDELNGITRDNQGRVRPRIARSFSSLSQAEDENGQSRIYLGVHWAFDKMEGIAMGRRIGDYVFQRGLVQQGA
jgi:membrane-associated phospholipid phosphatase